MRIIVVTHAYPRWDGDVAGWFVERLCLALAERGHRLHVVAPADGGKGGRDERHGLPVERVRYADPERETLAYRGTMTEATRSLSGLRRFYALIRALEGAALTEAHANGADLLHAHWWIPGGVSVRRAVRNERIPYVVTLHGTDVAVLYRSRLGRWLARRVLRDASAVTAVSRYLADQLEGLDVGRAVVQPMPAEILHPAAGAGRGGGVVTVGRLTRQKRIHLVLEALTRLPPDVTLTIVGDGPERGPLESLARTLGVESRARFLGTVPPAQVAQTIGHADVFAFPARREGFGLAVAEALGLGLPVVAMADAGGVLDMVTNDVGRIVRPDDARALAEGVREVLGDPTLRERAAAAGAELARRLAPAHVAARFEEVYGDALGTPR